MEMLPNSQKPTWLETVLKWAPIIGLGVAGFWFWGTIVTFVNATLKSTLLTVVYGAPLAILVGSILLYPKAWWMGYKSICKGITSWFIKIDPLSYMDRYADYLSEKLDNLNKTKIDLGGRQVAAGRRIDALKKEVEEHKRRGAAAIKMNDQNTASLEGTRLQGALNSIQTYTPNYERMTRSLKFLTEMGDNWGVTIIKLREEIARKREEYEVLRDEAKALGQAEEFLRGDTDAGRIYQESLKELEGRVTRMIAYVDDFEKRAEPILKGIEVDNQMQHDEGIAALEAYMKNSTAELDAPIPAPKFNTSGIQEVAYEEVGKAPFNLLK